MAREVPKAQTVHTTSYENLKGVDFTNDATNVWYRRSPDAVNMLPDDSGRPFKRTGWEVVIDADTLASKIGVADLEILKCHYFELAGIDHIFIFTNGGVFKYTGETDADGEPIVDLLSNGSADSTDIDCYSSYDRAFFFEGNGVSAFYIYGNYKVWVYGYDPESDTFSFKLANDGFDVGDITIPRVIIGADPSTCSGTMYEAYNLIGGKACVEYPSNDMFYYYTTADGFTFTIDQSVFKSGISALDNPNGTYAFTYSSTAEKWSMAGYEVNNGTETAKSASNITTADMESTYGITINGSLEDDDKIVVIYMYGVLLPNNVSQDQIDDVGAFTSVGVQYDTELDVLKEYDTSVPPNRVHPMAGECVLHTDEESNDKKAWVEFNSAISDTDDRIRVIFPVSTVTVTPFTELTPSDHTITLNGI